MKKFLIAIFLLAFTGSSFADAVVGYANRGTSFVISDERAVITQGKNKYVCEFNSHQNSEIDDDGHVYEANTYKCGDRFWFIAKHFLKTDVWQLRLYNGRTEKFLYDGYLDFSEFSIISKS